MSKKDEWRMKLMNGIISINGQESIFSQCDVALTVMGTPDDGILDLSSDTGSLD